ncbi:hypothetical protein, partial [Staphylococcus epidermidis]
MRVADRPVVLAATDAPFRRWSTGFSTQQVAQRRLQWAALQALPGAQGFFEVLRDLEVAPAGHADLQRRVW